MKSTGKTMQLMMSEGLADRVGDQSLRPRKDRIIAVLSSGESSFSLPVVCVIFNDSKLREISLGIQDVSILRELLSGNDNCLVIDDLNINYKNIYAGTYKLLEHDNYAYELLLNVEQNNG